MSAHTKTTFAALALVGAVLVSGLGSTAKAESGPDGVDGPEGRGAMLQKMFDSIDADKDGKVTEAELAAERAAKFTAADTNSDGKLDAAEISAQQLARMTETLAARSAKMIERMDNNGDGSLSAEELGESPMEERFARIDTDDDGAISQAEAKAAGDRMADHGGKRKHGDKDGGKDGKMGGWFN